MSDAYFGVVFKLPRFSGGNVFRLANESGGRLYETVIESRIESGWCISREDHAHFEAFGVEKFPLLRVGERGKPETFQKRAKGTSDVISSSLRPLSRNMWKIASLRAASSF